MLEYRVLGYRVLEYRVLEYRVLGYKEYQLLYRVLGAVVRKLEAEGSNTTGWGPRIRKSVIPLTW